MWCKINLIIEKLIPGSQLSISKNTILYKGPLFYHGGFYVLERYDIIMGGMVMELRIRKIGPGILSKFLRQKTIIDEDTKDIIFPPDNSVILFKEKKSK